MQKPKTNEQLRRYAAQKPETVARVLQRHTGDNRATRRAKNGATPRGTARFTAKKQWRLIDVNKHFRRNLGFIWQDDEVQ